MKITLYGEVLNFDMPENKNPMIYFRRTWFGNYYIHSLVITKTGEGKWHVKYDPAWWQKAMSWLGIGPTRSQMRLAIVSKIAQMVGSPLVISKKGDEFDLDKPENFAP